MIARYLQRGKSPVVSEIGALEHSNFQGVIITPHVGLI